MFMQQKASEIKALFNIIIGIYYTIKINVFKENNGSAFTYTSIITKRSKIKQ